MKARLPMSSARAYIYRPRRVSNLTDRIFSITPVCCRSVKARILDFGDGFVFVISWATDALVVVVIRVNVACLA